MIPIKSIDGLTLSTQPIEGGYTVLKSDLYASKSGRSAETGRLISNPIRFNIYKITLKFKGESEDIAKVDNIISGKSELDVTFLVGGVYVNAKMYPSDRTLNDNGMIAELSLSLIEY